LSDITDRVFFDTDNIIEKRESKRIPEIITEKGWDYFRTREKEVIRDVSKENNAVISLGGGALMDKENVESLKNSLFILLKADIQTMRGRMERDAPRPSLTNENPQTEIEVIMAERMPVYEEIADIIIDTDSLSVYEVCDKILLDLEKRRLM
jgi:shikimate kinase